MGSKKDFFTRIALRTLVGAYFAGFFFLVFFANSNDWDQQLSFLEVERRSWLWDFKLPLWSYQYCGGSSRAGDPQSFGLSPLFAFPDFFGSFFGAKLIVLFCAFVGFWYLKKTLFLLAGDKWDSRLNLAATCLSLLFVFQSYFLWNFYAGHLVYANAYLLYGVVYYCLLAQTRLLVPKEKFLGALLTATLLMGGMHFVLLFILFPAAVLGLPFLIYLLARGRFHRRRIPGFLLAGFIPSLAKFYYVLSYQHRFPRTLEQRTHEVYPFFRILYYFFVPTWAGHFVGGYAPNEIWSIWEFSFFGGLNVLAVAFGLWFLFRFRKRAAMKTGGWGLKGTALWMALGLFCFFLAWGDFAPWAPFTKLDQIVFSDSLRVPIRFIFSFLWFMPLVVFDWMTRMPLRARARFVNLAALLTVAGLGILAGFVPVLNWRETSHLVDLVDVESRAHLIIGGDMAHQYPAILEGQAVINCYSAINRSALFSEAKPTDAVELISDPQGLEDPRCVQESYFTQNDLHISPHCSPHVCLNVNALNMYEDSGFEFDPARKRFCRVQGPMGGTGSKL